MIKKYKEFLESISGTMDTMPFGPGMPRQELPNTLTSNNTETLFSETTGNFYTYDDYTTMYMEYLGKGGKPLEGFNIENLEDVLMILKN